MSYKATDGNSAPQTATSTDGYSLTIRSQSATGLTSNGGDLVLGSGAGTTRDGYVRIFSGATEVARASGGKFFMTGGQRITFDTVTTTPYTVTDGYYVILVNTSSPKTINLPANPNVGDAYNVKDLTGQASTGNITVSGNGKNIEPASTYVMNTNYASSIFMYNGTTWSVL